MQLSQFLSVWNGFLLLLFCFVVVLHFKDRLIVFGNLEKDKYKSHIRASLVAQWLRIRLPMQGTRVRPLVREDPTCCGATKPVCYNY